ncbi:MAG: hypothetical protein IPM69_08725 [Ignavibacteria bacterium]|nr:hypothetical protein [Ignavibacteria bacterium]
MKKLIITYFQRQAFQLCCLSIFMVLITTLEIKANDGFVDVIHGGVTLKNGNNATVQMDSEYVEIRLDKKYYTVTATFWLRNSGNARTIQIGFPHTFQNHRLESLDSSIFENSSNRMPEDSMFILNFNTFINDSLVAYKPFREYRTNMELRNSDNDEVITLKSPKHASRWWQRNGKGLSEQQRSSFYVNFKEDWLYWFVKKVNFQEDQTIKTAVEFKSKYIDPFYIGIDQGTYIFGSGKSWKGNILKSVFKISKAEEDSSTLRIELPNKYDTNKVVQRTKLPNGELLEFHNYKPDESDKIQFYIDATNKLE